MTSPQPGVTYTEEPPEGFSYEDYLAAMAAVVAALAVVLATVAVPYQAIRLTRRDWLNLLAVSYPQVEEARRQAAVLARRFYDSERAKHLGPIEVPRLPDGLQLPDGTPIDVLDPFFGNVKLWPRLNINLAPYSPDWYEEAMEAVLDDLIPAGASDGAVVKFIGAAQKEVEYGGRRTNLWAVDDDPDVIGWARVEGNENIGSCGFCAMLISRGPVYKLDPTNAGFNVDDEAEAVEIYRQGLATGKGIPTELMAKWHPNCDCKVVPVFDRANWPGKDQYEAMEDLWIDATKNVEPPDTLLNAFRRRIERGDLPAKIRRPRAA